MGAALWVALAGALWVPAEAQPIGVDPASAANRTTQKVAPDWSAPLRPLASLRTSIDRYGIVASVGDTVLVGGRVTAGTGLLRADVGEVYIQDGTAGLRLVLPSGSSPVMVGDSVLAHGIVSQHLGTLELAAPSVLKVEDASRREIEPLRLPDDDPQLEAVEGQLVEVRGHVTQSDSTAGGRLLVIISGTTATQIYAYRFRASPIDFGTIEVGDYVRVRGIAAQHDLAPPFTNSYIVFPRSSTDVRQIGISPSTYRTGAAIIAALLMAALLWAYILRRVVQARTAALAESETRYTHLFNAAADPVLVLDTDGIITESNDTGRRLFDVSGDGNEAEPPAPKPLRELATHPGAVDEHLADALRTGSASAVLELRQSNGRAVPFEVATRTLKIRKGTAFVSIARDIEERRTYEQGLLQAMTLAEEARQVSEQAREEAEAAAHLKSSILANMSHEIRTPLTAILGFSEVLREEVPTDLHEFADAIHTGGHRLLNTLNDILDLSRLDADRVELAPDRFDAVAATRESVRLLAQLAQKAGIGLRFGSSAPELHVGLSSAAFDRIVTNLVGNAIKFTPTGEVRVGLQACDDRLTLQVRDTGVGISEAFLPDLFEPFKQESNHEHRRDFEGTGLGLAITHRLVERLGGAIRVQSKKGVGSLFEVDLPLEAPSPDDPSSSDRSPVAQAIPVPRRAPDPDVPQ
ncbi:MAG: ATP-binding protein [Rubricoccaceae bacterium]